MEKGTKGIFEVIVPEFVFPGFYNTFFDSNNIFDEEGNEEEYIDLVVGNVLAHYRKVLPSGFELMEEKLESPKYYNYDNDKIHLKIECTYEDIIFHFFDYERDNLFDYLNLETYSDNYYHEAMLEVLLEFWPFVDDMDDLTLKKQFIYG